MDEDLKSASDSMHQPKQKPAYHPSPVKDNKPFPKRALIGLLIVVVITGAGFAALKNIHRPKKVIAVRSAVTQAVPKKSGDDIPIADATETYNSSALNVSFTYPKAWKVSEANGGIRVDSPQFKYPSINLGSVDGIFRVYIRQGARKVDGRYIGTGVAIKPSVKILYSKPIVGQHADSLLSLFGNNSTDVFTFFLIASNFQLDKGNTLGPNYGSEPDTYIVVGGYASTTATDDLAMNSVSLTYYDTTIAYKQAYGIITSLQLK